jgi:hypothetical protein
MFCSSHHAGLIIWISQSMHLSLTFLVARTLMPQQGQRYFRVLEGLGGGGVSVPL